MVPKEEELPGPGRCRVRVWLAHRGPSSGGIVNLRRLKCDLQLKLRPTMRRRRLGSWQHRGGFNLDYWQHRVFNPDYWQRSLQPGLLATQSIQLGLLATQSLHPGLSATQSLQPGLLATAKMTPTAMRTIASRQSYGLLSLCQCLWLGGRSAAPTLLDRLSFPFPVFC